MFYTVYKTTNQVNGKFYIGTHKTVDLNDDYLGSGVLLTRAIEKYGKEKFSREILFVFDNPDDMFAKEAEIVTDDFLAENNTYNLKKGGFGGFDYLNSDRYDNPTHRIDHIRKMNIARKHKFPNGVMFGRKMPPEFSQKLSDRFKGKPSPFLGKCHSEKTKELIGKKNSIHQIGSKNSQFGKIWIHNKQMKQSTRIAKEEPLPVGWEVGRKIKWD